MNGFIRKSEDPGKIHIEVENVERALCNIIGLKVAYIAIKMDSPKESDKITIN